ncbi:MAG: hypothetical protein ACLTBV_30010 [Enterocloster bolteae]
MNQAYEKRILALRHGAAVMAGSSDSLALQAHQERDAEGSSGGKQKRSSGLPESKSEAEEESKAVGEDAANYSLIQGRVRRL